MNGLKFITEKVSDHTHSQLSKNHYNIVTVVEMVPTFEGFLTPYLISEQDGSKSEVSIEDLYTDAEEYADFYEALVVGIAKDVLENREKSH